jgi:hypothetical protein
MQTFVPLADVPSTAVALDSKRLGKQIIEAGQIVRALSDPTYGWQNHPATKMWRGHGPALLEMYIPPLNAEWHRRYGRDHGAVANLHTWLTDRTLPGVAKLPWWWGWVELHASHRANLLRKDFAYYSTFGWSENPDTPYIWPDAVGSLH